MKAGYMSNYIQPKVLLPLFCFIIDSSISAQAPKLSTIVRPSPNVQAMQKYGDIPVSAYTGIPSISVPIYTIQFRDITLPINLGYHASGIKVSEEASQVGLGWTLNAGGTVSRNIIGKDDFLYGYFSNTLTDFSDSIAPQHTLFSPGCQLPLINTNTTAFFNVNLLSYLTANPVVDLQPDQYYFNCSGKSGKFILKRDKSAVLQTQEKVQITCNGNGTSFQIITEDGTKYDYAATEYFNDGAQNHTSAWYLTQITSPTGNVITFNYTTLANYVRPVSSYSETRDDWDAAVPALLGSDVYEASSLRNQNGITPGNQYYQKVLSTIDFTTGLVQFNYSYGRQDVQNDGRLDSVQIFTKDKSGVISATPIRTVVLSYDYFTSNADQGFGSLASSYDSWRLKLTQVQNIGYYGGTAVYDNPYKFSYYEPSTRPAKTSFAKDHWGYFNGKLGHATLIPSVVNINSGNLFTYQLGATGPERDPDTNYVRLFSLTSIQYPTGGSTEFQYEANDFDEANSEIYDNGFLFQPMNNLIPNTQTIDYNTVAQTYTNNNDTVFMQNEYWDTDPNGIRPNTSVQLVFRYQNGDCSTINLPGQELKFYCRVYDSTGTNILYTFDLADYTKCIGCSIYQTDSAICTGGGPVFVVNKLIQLLPGKYVWKAFSTISGTADIQVTFKWYTSSIASPSGSGGGVNITYAGGLRIKRIYDHDAINAANDQVRKYVYHYFADKNNDGIQEEYSYGRRMTCPRYSYFDMSLDNSSVVIQGGGCASITYNCIHLMRSSDSENPLNGSASGSVVGYDQVVELFGENGENGKKVYQYVNDPDIVVGFYEGITGSSMPFRPPSGAPISNPFNGQLLQEIDYADVNGGFLKTREIDNRYTPSNLKKNYVYGVEDRVMRVITHADKCTTPFTGQCDGNFLLTYTALVSQWNYLATTDEKVYNQGDSTQYIETVTNYTYDTTTLLPTVTQTTNSKGEQIKTTVKYPLNYTTTNATDPFTLGVKYLQNNHVISAPVETSKQISNSDGTNSRTVASILTTYSNTDPVPSLLYQSQPQSPIYGFVPSSINASGLVKDASYNPAILFDSYDLYGNLLQQRKANDMYISYIWDYKNSYPIAEVKNAKQSDIAYTSFEFDGNGNWSIGSSSRLTNGGITGSCHYNLGNGNITKSGLDATKSYIVSYWSKTTAASVNGVSATQGPTYLGWTYYEHIIPAGATSVTVSGSVQIDELRLYPANAQMTTYSFIPLIGMDSQCDVNNHITYYEYDGLGRLLDIRDMRNYILKTFKYNYKQ